MNRRIVGVVAALVLAIVGTVALVAYVGTAEQRALAGERLVDVFVVVEPIPAGTPVEQVVALVEPEQVPIKVAAEGAVQDLGRLSGLVVGVDLVPGEQLIASRFAQRTAFADREVGIDVPDDMIEVTIELAAQRAVGGLLQPGQRVAVLASFEPFSINQPVIEVEGQPIPIPAALAGSTGDSTPNSTDLLLRKVLVTAVQEPAGTRPSDERRLSEAPDGSVSVTLAVEPFDAERLVFTAEFGQIWLAIERDTVPERDEPGQTRGSVLDDRGSR